MTALVPLLVPTIANLQKGLNYDFVGGLEVNYENEVAQEPIEDPERSYSSDHNREMPTTLRIDLEVSAFGHTAFDQEKDGAQRIDALEAALLNLRAMQAVSPTAYFDVFSGTRIHRNCQILRMRVTRDNDNISVARISLSLREQRFSLTPRLSPIKYLLDANKGATSEQNGQLVTEQDRMITEATLIRRAARISVLSNGGLLTGIAW